MRVAHRGCQVENLARLAGHAPGAGRVPRGLGADLAGPRRVATVHEPRRALDALPLDAAARGNADDAFGVGEDCPFDLRQRLLHLLDEGSALGRGLPGRERAEDLGGALDPLQPVVEVVVEHIGNLDRVLPVEHPGLRFEAFARDGADPDAHRERAQHGQRGQHPADRTRERAPRIEPLEGKTHQPLLQRRDGSHVNS